MTTIVSMKSNSGNKNCSIGMKNKIKYNNDGAIALTCKNKDERKHHIDTMSPTNKTNTYKQVKNKHNKTTLQSNKRKQQFHRQAKQTNKMCITMLTYNNQTSHKIYVANFGTFMK